MARRGPTRASEGRRRQILQAALECFLESGIAPTTIDDIRRRSGASVGSISHHYGTKEELAGALFAEGLRRFHSGFVPAVTRRRTARTGIESGVRHHVEWFDENPDWGRFLLHMREVELLETTLVPIRALNRSEILRVVDWLRPYVERGEVADLPVSLLTSLWIGPSQEYCRQRLSGIATTPPERATPILASAAWHALSGGS